MASLPVRRVAGERQRGDHGPRARDERRLASPLLREMAMNESQQPRVLVVDDDPVSCGMIADVLAGAGYEVDWTSVAAVAVECVSARGYSLVVSDVNMPHMLGTEFAAEVARRAPGLPMLLLSARADGRLRIEVDALGARLLAKPAGRETLLATVRELLAASRAGAPGGERGPG